MSAATKQSEKQEAIERLRGILQPGDVVYSCSPGNDPATEYLVAKMDDYTGKPGIIDITYLVARILGLRRTKYGGLTASPAEVVCHLGGALWGYSGAAHLGYVSRRNGSTDPEDNGEFMLTHYRL